MIFHGILMVNVIAEYIPVGSQILAMGITFSGAPLKKEKLSGDSQEMIIMQAGLNPLNLLKVQ
jgi:hypothetical protein